MTLPVQQTRASVSLVAIACSFLFFCCTSTQPVPRYTKKPLPAHPVSQFSIVLPEGWSDITSKSNVPSVLLWFVNRDYSGSMVLREFQTDSLSGSVLLKEDICSMAHISLRLKLADDSVQRRITRMPEMANKFSDVCTYVYDENGLLRRVMMYRKQQRAYELELLQENASVPFDGLTADQIRLLDALVRK